MIEFRNGNIYVDGVETIDAELIGLAILDYNEQNAGKQIIISTVCDKPLGYHHNCHQYEPVDEYESDDDHELDIIPAS